MNMWRMLPGFVGAAILVAGCGQKTGEAASEKMLEAAIEQEGGGKTKVDLSEGSFIVTSDKGSMKVTSGKSAEVPETFPADVYVYTGAEIASAMELPVAHILSLTTKDDASKVVETYKKEMTGNGWKQDSALDRGKQVTLTYKKNNQTAMVSVTALGGGTQIALSVVKAE